MVLGTGWGGGRRREEKEEEGKKGGKRDGNTGWLLMEFLNVLLIFKFPFSNGNVIKNI